MNKKLFTVETLAIEFADKVNGTVIMRQLPGYMSVEIVWIVEWKE